jgi:phosphatidylglycerol lysyltransferase
VKTTRPIARRSIQSQYLVRSTIALIAAALGLADLVSALFPRLHWQLVLAAWPLAVHYHTFALTVVIDLFLVMLSYGLLHGKRQAWRIVLALLLSSVLLQALRRGSLLPAVASTVLVLLLLAYSSSFHVRSNPPSIRRGYLATALGLGLMALYAFGGFLTLSAHMHVPTGTQVLLFERVLPILCVCAVLYGMGAILRPVASTLLPKKQRQAVAELVSCHGSNSISYFALGAEKCTFFSSSGKAIISYVLKGDVALVVGDPIGPEEELPTVIGEFLTVCRQQDWIPAFWQVREECAELYRSFGLHLLKIGEDAVIRTDGFTLKGKAMANVRSSARRAEKEGVRVVFYRGQIEHAEELFQMQLISWSWLASKGGSEMGFSMGHFDIREEDDRQVSALVVDGTNRVHAFVTFIPIYGRHGWGLDLMRRAEQAVPGCMELLLSCSIDYLKSTGAEMISLGLAPMSKVNQEDQTALDSIIDFLTQRYGYLNQSQSLFKFKQKFQPSWESRYLVYPHSSHLPKIGWALYAAHQQDTSLIALTRRSMRNWQRKLLAGTRRKTGPREVVTHPGTGQLAI